MMGLESGFAAVNGTRLHFEQTGAGHPLVLLHGLGLDMRMWDDQFADFAHHYRVVRYDMRGFGHSLPSAATPFSHADDLKGLLDHLGIERAHILGLSLGGRIAVDFALLYPEAVGRLVLVDSALGGYRLSEAWSALMTPILAHGQNGEVAAAKRLWLSHPLFEPILANERCSQRFQHIVENYSGWHWINQGLEQPPNPPAAERLGTVHAPMLVIVGERDLPDFHAIADFLQKNVPHARKIELPGAGHMSSMEAPDRFNESVLAYLREE